MVGIKKVVVLGCGPSGLLAAHAAVHSGYDVTIYSSKERSKIGGAQYLHKPIPGLTPEDPDGEVTYIYKGTKAGYASKVYGDYAAPVSWGKFRGVLNVWNLRAVYDELWNSYEHLIENRVLLPNEVCTIRQPGTLVLSTIPLAAICLRADLHSFNGQRVLIGYKQFKPENNYIIYNGSPGELWYRHSHLFGWRSMEYPESPAVLLQTELVKGLTTVNKPISSNCNCLPTVVKLGRYGSWKKNALTHDAYFGAVSAMRVVELGGNDDAVQ